MARSHTMDLTNPSVANRSIESPFYQAFQILHLGFTVAPILFGLDKFFNVLTNWEAYLAPFLAGLLPLEAGVFMRAVGVVEILAGLIVAIKPRYGAYLVAVWLLGIIVNLLLHGAYFDVALRDFGLFLGALALGRLSGEFDRA